MGEKEKVEISICMGSSCYSRGNRDNLQVIQDFLAEFELEERVELKGQLCQGDCDKGPNMMVGGRKYSEVDPVSIRTILQKELLE